MTVPLMEPRRLPVSRSTSAGRRRRLHRGVDRWHQAMVYDRVCRRRVWLLLFTTETADPEVVQGEMRRFWAAVHQRWGVQARFSWLELTAKGAAHYHCMWVDPPLPDTPATKRWLEHTWGLGFVKIHQRARSWFMQHASHYVKDETKASLKKGYQQDYSSIPRSIRTFECQRLEFSGEHLDAHRDRQLVDYVPAGRTDFQAVAGRLPQSESVGLELEPLGRHQIRSASDIPGGSERQNGSGAQDTSIRKEGGRELVDVGVGQLKPRPGDDGDAYLIYWADSRHVERCRNGCQLWRFRRNLRQMKTPHVFPSPRGASRGVTRVSYTRGLRGGGAPPLRSV